LLKPIDFYQACKFTFLILTPEIAIIRLGINVKQLWEEKNNKGKASEQQLLKLEEVNICL